MAAIVVDNIASEAMTHLASAIRQATIDQVNVFGEVSIVNDVESFLSSSGTLNVEAKPEVGIVRGTVEERSGTSNYERAICRLPFDIVVRFTHLRKMGEDERGAMDKAEWLIEAIKVAIMDDASRGGLCNLLEFGSDVINGTTVYGFARPVTAKASPNEAFFAATIGGAIAWSRF